MTRTHVAGTISSVRFVSGDRFVVGSWRESPVGPFGDVMWARSEGTRTLLAQDAVSAAFITSIYEFDEVVVGDLAVTSDGRRTRVASGPACHDLTLDLIGGRLWPIPFPRPLAVTRIVEAPIARALMGVETHGVSAKGATEWYQSRGWRWVRQASGSIDGRTLDPMTDVRPGLGVGFSEPPRRPSIVAVRVTIDLPA